ncbi:probable ATP-dependent RNA helicase DDX31 [Lampris incognitus]|uniref:probable ATP-dependent RNA helicase DDX31 n=1 Tax=Lampris incognitus TaxID=2546036 RepID=UPI0024B5B891|nr:probable ATP-dependent RNA helicase DDX31 [Lampris incognitus]
MTSSPGDQLCLNITTDVSTPSKKKSTRQQAKWVQKRQKAKKRSLSTSVEAFNGVSSKQRRLEQSADSIRSQEEQQSLSGGDPPPPTAVFAPPAQNLGKERGRGGVGGASFKTSSLFKHNPDIPEIHRSAVSPINEKIFTSDSFAELDLHPHLVATLNKVLNVTTMTSVQKQTIPILLSGRDAVVRSQTGSGKTLCYGIPVVQFLQAVQPKIQRSDGPLVLVIVPTRELALQTFQTFQKLLKPFTWIVPGVLMGGEKRKAEKARLRKGINILVSTPGRLVDHIKHTLSIAFSAVRWLILDEADRTLDLGFEKDLTVILNSLNSTGPARQNVLLSATLTPGLSRLTDVCMNEPVSIQVSNPSSSCITTTCDLSQASQSESFAVPEALNQYVVVVPSKLRLVCLAAFILAKCKFSQGNKIIVFISSYEAVEFLFSLFTSVLGPLSTNHKPPFKFLRLHGNMRQEERTNVFDEFSVSKTGILLCTDVAARGLDLPQVTWIIQYNPSSTVAEYIHRVGRTARIGAKGNSLLFVTPAETAYITELANHNISLSEMKLLNILSNLMLDDTYKGRGKYHSKTSSKALEQEVRERATVLQTEFENFVHTNQQAVQSAKRALQSFLRAYTTYPASFKHIFHIRSLHLGHAAKSFGLRDAPQGLASSAGDAADHTARSRKHAKNPVHQAGKQEDGEPRAGGRKAAGWREVSMLRSEFSSGMEGDHSQKKKRKKRNTAGGQVEEE